jgi:hypothetical protein
MEFEMEKGKGNPLQPHTILEILDHTFRIYRENFLTFLVPIALVTIPITVINLVGTVLYSQRAQELQPLLEDLQNSSRGASAAMQAELLRASSEIISVALIYLAVVAITTLLQVVLVQGIMTQLASESFLGYRRPTAGEAFNAIRERLMPLTGAVIAEFVIFVILIIIIGLFTVALPLCAILVLPSVYIWLAMFTLMTPVMVLERTPISSGIRRAWSLGKSRIWQIMGLTIAIAIINYIITFGLQALLGIFVPQTDSLSFSAGDILSLVVQSIISTLISPIIPIAYTLLYYDARVRIEGLDIAFENSGINDPRPADLESPTPTDSLLSSKDVGNMVIFSIVLIGVVGLLSCGLVALLGPLLPSRF